MIFPRVIQAIVFASLSISLVSCQSLNSAVGTYFDMDTDLQIDFVVDADINPDELGKASPLFIRMYELKNSKMMKKADFIDIYERDKEALGADFVAVHKLKRFKPGESRIEHFVLDKKTDYVAFYAEFLEFKDSKYKLIVPVIANNVVRTTAVVRVAGNTISVDKDYEDTDDEDKLKEDVDDAKATADKAKKTSDKLQKLF